MVSVSVRLPDKLKLDIDKLVKKGYFKNFSDAVISSLRIEVRERDAVLRARDARRKIERGYLKKAGGDEKKAWDLYFKDLKKGEELDPDFFRD